MPGAPIRVAIVDDHPVARCGMEHIFDAEPGLKVVGAVAGLADLRAGMQSGDIAPDVVILDLYLDDGRLSSGQIAEVTRRCPVLVVSVSARRQDVLAAIRAGASGYLIKAAAVDQFAAAVRTVISGGFYVSSQLADLIDASAAAEGPGQSNTAAEGPGQSNTAADPMALAPRERQALSLIAQGFTQAQAALRMGVSPATIDTYIKRIRRKLGPGNKAELTRRAIELGEVDEASLI